MWDIELTPEFEHWFNQLEEEVKSEAEAAIDLLADSGPGLGRPKVDTLQGTRISNLKELRVGTIRMLFAFDRRRVGLMLVGGNKRNNWTKWYGPAIQEAERLWERHTEELSQEGWTDA